MSLTSTAYRHSAFLLLLLVYQWVSAQQLPPQKMEVVRLAGLDSITVIPETADSAAGKNTLARAANPHRVWTVAGVHAGLYAGSLILLNEAWYKGYPKTSFQTFDDSKEWLQVDKVGHAWTAYQLSRGSMASWKWAGLNEKQQVWLGGLSGFAFLTVIEFLDAHSAEWGWSWGDMAANTLGSSLMVAQQLGWKEQRISFKLFGTSTAEKMLKDYNGQTYWLSANLKSFFRQSKLPPWLNIAVGYGADGMYGGFSNTWTDESTGISYDYTQVPRVRQWYLAPDIDFTRIPTKSKFLRSVFFCLNAFKLPAPTLQYSNGKFTFYGLYF
ncbi:MAG: YfiM family protein [Chitinophagaceae bacterium]|nr:YfiM family protein [Chitinophagaceae bacterium]